MKKYIFILFILLMIIAVVIIFRNLTPWGEFSADQDSISVAVPVSKADFNVDQISFTEWNTPSGLPYTQVPGANLGTTSFQLINDEQIAFLCNSTSEIIITHQSTGQLMKKWPVSFAPRDFVFDNGWYYVLTEYEVTVYDETGNELKKYPFPSTYKGVERVSRNNDATYLLLPSGNSLMIENCGTPVKPVEYSGTITGTGLFVKTQIAGNNSWSVKMLFSDDKIIEKTFTTDKKVAGVFVVGATENRVILDVQTFISENPISVERKVTSVIPDKNGPDSVVCTREVPDGYFVISNRDFYVGPNGNIYQMMTSPRGVFVFSLTETEAEKARGYPSSLTENTFQSNEHLIKQD